MKKSPAILVCCQTLALACCLIALPRSSPAAGRPINDDGTFQISVGGKPAGTEKFSIQTSNGKVNVKVHTDLSTTEGGKRQEFSSSSDLVLDGTLHPLTYTWKQEGAHSSGMEIDFQSTPASAKYHTVDGKTDERKIKLPKDLVVLDDNVLTDYEILVERYRQTAGGKQVFTAFIPQEALSGKVTMEKAGQESLKSGAKKIEATHYTVTTDLAKIDLWVDDNGRVLQVSAPAAQLEAVRE